MDSLQISLVQFSISWEDKIANLNHCEKLLSTLAGKTDLVVLPEMFSTGFSMDCSHLAETNEEPTIQALKNWANTYQFAVCGSFLAKNDEGQLFNRGFFITPEDEAYFYDKRHLFSMGNEDKQFASGDRQLIVSYKGWNICLIICYDLRFPVWIRNVNNAYDLLICAANWPQAREKVWQVLLKARAIENQCFVCGVNRIGEDGLQIKHKGDSMLIDFKGEITAQCQENKEEIINTAISKSRLEHFREKFPAWKDSDFFEIKY